VRDKGDRCGTGTSLGQTRVKRKTAAEFFMYRFYQQVCSNLHMFFLIGDDQTQKQLPSTLFLRLLQLATASIDRYEPWDQTSLVMVAQYHLKDAHSPPLDDGEPFSLVLTTYLNQLPMRVIICLSSPLLSFPLLSCLSLSLTFSALLSDLRKGPFSFLIPYKSTTPG
jgi:hypothetical protein